MNDTLPVWHGRTALGLKARASTEFRLHIYPKDIRERMGPVCAACGLPTPDHFRGGNGNRFVGCGGAKVRERERRR